VDLNTTKRMGKGESYIAPDPHFISSISLFASSLPWDKFERFFEKKRLVNLPGDEQLILLRLLALQELLCLDDNELLTWAKHQLYLFSFMQTGFKARLPTKELLVEFRAKFDKVGLLAPFRKQCQRIISEHENRYPPIIKSRHDTSKSTHQRVNNKYQKASALKADLPNVENSSNTTCPSCGSRNVVKLKPSQEASSLPNVHFSRCRFCGHTFRD